MWRTPRQRPQRRRPLLHPLTSLEHSGTSLPHFGGWQVLRNLMWLGAPAWAWRLDRPGMVQPLPSPTCLPPKEGSTWTPLEGRP